MSHLKDTWVENEVFHASDLNEIARTINGIINDTEVSAESTYSSEKLVEMMLDLGFKTKFVNVLPTIGEKNTIYFVPSEESGATNATLEYMWIDSAWELIGSTSVDMSNYFTKAETEQMFADVELELSGKADTNHTHLMSELTNDAHFAKLVKLTQAEYDELVNEGTIDEDAIYMITASTPSAVTATFVDYDSTVLQTVSVAPGDTPAYTGETPTRESDYDPVQNIGSAYTFSGWAPALGPITANTTFTAQYSVELFTRVTTHRFIRLKEEQDFSHTKNYVIVASPDDFIDHSVSIYVNADYNTTSNYYNYVGMTLTDVEDGWDSVQYFDVDESVMGDLTAFITLEDVDETAQVLWHNNSAQNDLYIGANSSKNQFVSASTQDGTNYYRWVLDYDANDEYLDIRNVGRGSATVRYNASAQRFAPYTSKTGYEAYLFSYEPFEEDVPLLQDSEQTSNGPQANLLLMAAGGHEYKPHADSGELFIVGQEEDDNNNER